MASNRVVVQEGYALPFSGFDGYRRRKKRRSSRRRAPRGAKARGTKLARAAKHCKGKSMRAFHACMKAYFKK